MMAQADDIRILIFSRNTSEADAICLQVEGIDLPYEIQIAKSQKDYIKKILRFEPSVVIVTQQKGNYSAADAYQDLRRSLPYSFFILIISDCSGEEMRNYSLSGIDAFLPQGDYSLLKLVIMQGFNRKHLEKDMSQANQLMLERHHQLRSVFNNDQNAVFIVNFRNEIIDLNPAAFSFLEGKKMETVLGRDLNAYIARQDSKKIKAAHASAYRGKKSSGEYTFNFPGGLTKHASINFVPIMKEEGGVISVMMICKDFTDTYLLWRKSKITEDRFLALANDAPVGIYYSDTNGKCLFMNRKWSEYSGLTFEESIREGWLKSVHPGDRQRLAKIISEKRAGNATYTADFRIIHTDGSVLWMSLKTSPFIDENGEQLGSIGTISDITGYKMLISEIEQAQKERQLLLEFQGAGEVQRDLLNDAVTWSDAVYRLFEVEGSKGFLEVNRSIREYLQRNTVPEKSDKSEGEIIRSEFRIVMPSGKTKQIKSISVYRRSLEGKPVKLVSFLRDISADERQVKDQQGFQLKQL